LNGGKPGCTVFRYSNCSTTPAALIVDEQATWRIIYPIDSDAIIIVAVLSIKTRATPKAVIDDAKSD
jgi:hypothetical protein